MKLLVCGGRDYRDREMVWATLSAAVHYANCERIICGYDPESTRYQGADQLAYEWAVEHEFPCDTFPADWDTWGRAAGPRRNTQMAEAKPDECVAFPRANGEWGAGTLDMIGKAARAGASVHRVARERSEHLSPPSSEEDGPGKTQPQLKNTQTQQLSVQALLRSSNDKRPPVSRGPSSRQQGDAGQVTSRTPTSAA